ncbi:MAG: CarD family transcriptional regulator [Collinsella sp.]|nr:CarD family transcriptional regulator [Collinsella sp.]
MFSIGQHVIHPGQGVCTVVGFREDTPQPMLLLETKQGHAQTILMYPVAQADRLHAAISQQDAEHLLSHYDELECDTFTERNSSLEETHFKQQLKLGAPETVRVAKTMMHRIRQAEEADKKPSSYYMRVLKEAKRRSIEEIAVALGVTEEDAEARLSQAALNYPAKKGQVYFGRFYLAKRQQTLGKWSGAPFCL